MLDTSQQEMIAQSQGGNEEEPNVDSDEKDGPGNSDSDEAMQVGYAHLVFKGHAIQT